MVLESTLCLWWAWFQGRTLCLCYRTPEKDDRQVVLYPVSAKRLAAVMWLYGGQRPVAAGGVHHVESQWVNQWGWEEWRR